MNDGKHEKRNKISMPYDPLALTRTTEFAEFCGMNAVRLISRWKKEDGLQDLKKAMGFLTWMIRSIEEGSEDEAGENRT